MKRADLERHLRKNGCEVKREGGKHCFWWHPESKLTASVPRHNEIKNWTAIGICQGLKIPPPEKY